MTIQAFVRLKKGEDRRIRGGHPWIYSNEINVSLTPLKTFTAGEEVRIEAHDSTVLGNGYINPHSLIAVRMLTRNPDQHLDLHFFQQQLKEALSLRSLLFTKPYYRMVFGEADNLPGLVIDRFNQHIVVQINTAGMEQKQDVIIEALRSVLPDLQTILLRNDSSIREQEGLDTYIKAAYGTPPDEIIIEENNAQFAIPFCKGQKTGWFYDHRMNRARLKNYVENKTVLDVFSYLGGWGIQAATFGASQVDCIESSAFACDFIRKNAELNHVASNVNVICDDAFDAMKKLIQSGKKYDVVVLDPPAFVKKFKDKKEGLIAYQRANELALKLLTTNGILVSCSCSMHISMEDLTEILKRAAFRTQHNIQILERGHQGPDHPLHIAIPETDYLKAIFVRKN